MTTITVLLGLGILAIVALLGVIKLAVTLGALYRKIMNMEEFPDQPDQTKSQGYGLRENPFLMRVIAGLVLILVSLVPLSFVSDLVKERGRLFNDVANRMSGEWGGPQKIAGPVLSIPYEYTELVKERIENKVTGDVRYEDRPVTKTNTLVILPEKLSVTTELKTQELSRGIYRVPIYTSENKMTGSFRWPDLSVLGHEVNKFYWGKSAVVFFIEDAKGIQAGTHFTWNGQPADLSPGIAGDVTVSAQHQGIHARINLNKDIENTPVPFELSLTLRGSRSFSYAPTGKDSVVNMKANWKDPSFQGKLLPASRNIDADKFDAEWGVTYLSRPYEQIESLVPEAQDKFFKDLKDFSFGVDLFNSVNLYVLLNRTIKYGIMFISLTFFSIFIIEFASGAKLHWLQHLIIGAGLCMFYLCVLAFSEHIPFGKAYAIGVALITMIVGSYAWMAMGRALYGIVIGGIMLALYSILYSILQMEDYSLLIGTLLLLAFLVIGMFVTRNMGKKYQNQVVS